MLSENAQQRLPNSFAPVIIIFDIKQKSNTSDEKSRRATLPGAIAMAWWISCTGKTKNAEPTVAGVKGENRRQGPAISSASNISIPDFGKKVNPQRKKSMGSSSDVGLLFLISGLEGGEEIHSLGRIAIGHFKIGVLTVAKLHIRIKTEEEIG